MSEQDQLIGIHPQTPHIFGLWWQSTDLPPTANKKHRMLEENVSYRAAAVDMLAQWIVDYHAHKHQLRRITEQKAILDKYHLGKYVDKLKILPTSDTTQKGNLGEIVLIEYLKNSRGFIPYVHKLQYNPNSNQSMKGDDVLLFNPKDLNSEVIYGECKFRSKPAKQVVKDIINNLEGDERFPASIEFVANVLEDRGQYDLADAITDLHIKIADMVVPVTNIGFLISTKSATRASDDTTKTVEKHLNTTNPRFVMISLGIDNPSQIVIDSFKKADAILKTV